MSAALRTETGPRRSLRILVVAGEPLDALALERLCGAILGGRLERSASAHTVAEAAALLAQAAFDVVLLDPELPPGDGLELFDRRSPGAFQTIVVSARRDLALRAFECGVLDFVPRPVTRTRLARALGRLDGAGRAPVLAVRRLGRIDLVPVDDVLYAEGADKYAELVLANGQRRFYDQGLGRLEAALPHSFIRIHKSYLVRFDLLTRLRVLKGSRYFAELKNGQRLPVGRSRYDTLRARLI